MSRALFAINNADGSWTIAGIDATYNQIRVAGIVAPGFDPHFRYNNLFCALAFAPYAVNYLGIVFWVPGLEDVNLCSETGGGGSGAYASILGDGSSDQFTQVDFLQLSASKTAPPISGPTTLALLVEDQLLRA